MMPAARERLRSWFYRPWFLAMIAAVLSASLLIAGGLFVAIHQVEHVTIVWQGEHHGEWAAVLRFPRSFEARLAAPMPLVR